MDNIGSKDNISSVVVASVNKQLKSFRILEVESFKNILKYRFISTLIRNKDFLKILSDKDIDSINDYMFKLRLKPDIILCGDLGDDKVFIGNIHTEEDSATMAELEKLKKIVYEMVDYKPFNYREIFLNTFNYGNRT